MVEYDARTALIVVDVQNDFADPAGSLSVRDGHAIVPVVNTEVERALAAGAFVVYTQDWHPETTPHFAKDGGIWPIHCLRGSRGAAFHPDLRVQGPTVRKGVDGRDGYSGFSVRDPRSGDVSATALGALLTAHGVGRVVVVGLATDYCVVETVLDARRLGFDAVVLTEGIRAVDLGSGDGERALGRMRQAGATIV